MENNTEEQILDRFWTIPNVLSLLRIALIPVIVITYVVQNNNLAAVILVILSFLTDVVDGWIARRFHMISKIGKVLDPAADKLTQAAILICLVFRFPHMIYPAVFIFIKEFTILGFGIYMYRNTGKVKGALWYGKAATGLLYATFAIHLIWPSLPSWLSDLLIILCMAMMIYAFVMYMIRIFNVLNGHDDMRA